MTTELRTEDLPRFQGEAFENHQLAQVIAQTRFPPLTRFTDAARMQELQEALRRDYPLYSEDTAINVVFGPEGVKPERGARLLRFTSLDGFWSVVLSADFVALDSRRYSDIDSFTQRIANVWREVARLFDPQYQTRVGLRFINELRVPDGDSYGRWRELLNPELVGFDAGVTFGGSVSHTVAETLVQRPDGQLLVRRGFLRGTTVPPLAGSVAETGPFYLLDIDYFDATHREFEPAPSDRLRQYDDFLYRIFRWVIGDGDLYRYLKGAL
jgi:uncharacterized protein (TIGR04255 family)